MSNQPRYFDGYSLDDHEAALLNLIYGRCRLSIDAAAVFLGIDQSVAKGLVRGALSRIGRVAV